MKTAVIVLALATVAYARPQQFQQQQQQQIQVTQQTQQYVRQDIAQPQAKPIAIVKLASDVQPDGSFQYEYETENGIKADARGILNNAGSENEALSVQGSYSFVADDGVTYTVTWVADENGFQPQGAHLPVAPPVPEEILRSLEYNAAHPEEDEEAAKRKN